MVMSIYLLSSTASVDGSNYLESPIQVQRAQRALSLNTADDLVLPPLIRSDRGSQFVNSLIEQLSELFLTDQELTTAYSKERNAIVERANKEVMRHLRAMI